MNNQASVMLITGCSSGFGKELTIQAAKRGYQVIATARQMKDLEYAQSIENVFCAQLDIADRESIDKALALCISKFSKIDILINNAGINYCSYLADVEEHKMRQVFEINIIGTIQMTQATLKLMREVDSGMIVNISSGAGLSSTPTSFCYSISKYAIEGISANIRKEESNRKGNIKVITVNPGAFKTDILKKSLEVGEKIFKEQSDYPFMNGDTVLASRQILDSIEDDKIHSRLVLGTDGMRKFKDAITCARRDWAYNRKISINKLPFRKKVKNLLLRFKDIAKKIKNGLLIRLRTNK